MKIDILCTSSSHPIYPLLADWVEKYRNNHEVELLSSKNELSDGDILFLISCHEILDKDTTGKYKLTLVVHASDLPKGKGWSPHVWQILEGQNKITVTLLEAAENVDSGNILHQILITLEGHELFQEINQKLFQAELELMDYAIMNINNMKPRVQKNNGESFYRRRTPEDSELDIDKTIAQQFNLLRVADPKRYPAFFNYLGHRFKLTIEKIDEKATLKNSKTDGNGNE